MAEEEPPSDPIGGWEGAVSPEDESAPVVEDEDLSGDDGDRPQGSSSGPGRSATWLVTLGRSMYVVGTAFLLGYLFLGRSIERIGGDPAGGMAVATIVAVIGALVFVLGWGWRTVAR